MGLTSRSLAAAILASGLAAASSVHAAIHTFDFTAGPNTWIDGPLGNTLTFSSGPLSVDVQAFRYIRNRPDDPAFLGKFSSGLGVTNRYESGFSNTHLVDNRYFFDYAVFTFSQAVVPGSVTIRIYDPQPFRNIWPDGDISYFDGLPENAFVLPPSNEFHSLAYCTYDNCRGTSYTHTLSDLTDPITQLSIAARIDDYDRDDGFKIASLTVEHTPVITPEVDAAVPVPAALSLFVSAVAGLCLIGRRQRSRAA